MLIALQHRRVQHSRNMDRGEIPKDLEHEPTNCWQAILIYVTFVSTSCSRFVKKASVQLTHVRLPMLPSKHPENSLKRTHRTKRSDREPLTHQHISLIGRRHGG